jgi:hypothetical protein
LKSATAARFVAPRDKTFANADPATIDAAATTQGSKPHEYGERPTIQPHAAA